MSTLLGAAGNSIFGNILTRTAIGAATGAVVAKMNDREAWKGALIGGAIAGPGIALARRIPIVSGSMKQMGLEKAGMKEVWDTAIRGIGRRTGSLDHLGNLIEGKEGLHRFVKPLTGATIGAGIGLVGGGMIGHGGKGALLGAAVGAIAGTGVGPQTTKQFSERMSRIKAAKGDTSRFSTVASKVKDKAVNLSEEATKKVADFDKSIAAEKSVAVGGSERRAELLKYKLAREAEQQHGTVGEAIANRQEQVDTLKSELEAINPKAKGAAEKISNYEKQIRKGEKYIDRLRDGADIKLNEHFDGDYDAEMKHYVGKRREAISNIKRLREEKNAFIQTEKINANPASPGYGAPKSESSKIEPPAGTTETESKKYQDPEPESFLSDVREKAERLEAEKINRKGQGELFDQHPSHRTVVTVPPKSHEQGELFPGLDPTQKNVPLGNTVEPTRVNELGAGTDVPPPSGSNTPTIGNEVNDRGVDAKEWAENQRINTTPRPIGTDTKPPMGRQFFDDVRGETIYTSERQEQRMNDIMQSVMDKKLSPEEGKILMEREMRNFAANPSWRLNPHLFNQRDAGINNMNNSPHTPSINTNELNKRANDIINGKIN